VEVGAERYVLASVIDITDRKQAVADLHESQSELRQLSGSLIDAQETERRRIARELHDDFSQSLALLAIQIDMLKQAPGTPAELTGRVDGVSKRVKALSTAIHTLSHELHPLKLEQLGLVAAVRGLCQELAENHDLRVQFESRGSIEKVPPDAALCLYRIAQEALRNVVKHSGTTTAAVGLESTGGLLVLRVSDHGRGFDPALKDGRGGLGLLSMRERLRLVGGELAIESQPCGGTRVEARVPVTAATPAASRTEAASSSLVEVVS
jgi:signal transduction histidine kinase